MQLREEELATQLEEETKRNAWAEADVSSEVSLSDTVIPAGASTNGSSSTDNDTLRRGR